MLIARERADFSEVAGTNMTKIGKVLADVRDQLGIPYQDDYGQRRPVHSFRHTMISTCLTGLGRKPCSFAAGGWS